MLYSLPDFYLFILKTIKELRNKRHDYRPHEKVRLEWDLLLIHRHKQDAFIEEKYATNSLHQQQIGTWDGWMKQFYQRSYEAKYLHGGRGWRGVALTK